MKYSFRPSAIKRKRKHGFRHRNKKHRKILLRRIAKGRKVLSA